MTNTKPKFRRRADARPDEILDAALAVFTDKGFEAARMDDIAAKASISKGSVYLYFDSKEALLRGLIEREVAPVATRMTALVEAGGDDPKETMTMLIKVLSHAIDEERLFATPRLVLSVSSRFKEIAEFYRQRVVDQGFAALMQLHKKGVEAGVFKDVDSETVVRMIIGPIFIHAIRKHVLGAEDHSAPAVRAEAHLDILFEGLVVK